MRKNISTEERLLISILFNKKSINQEIFTKVDLDRLIYILGQNLIIPLFYVKIKEKKIETKFPKEFRDYLRYIYEKNRERNLILIREIDELSSILKKNKIRHLFLKGSYLVSRNYYKDFAERMVGDIDFLIHEEDRGKLIKILKINKYKEVNGGKYFEYLDRHIPRMTHKNKCFAIEAHTYLIKEKKYPNALLMEIFKNWKSSSDNQKKLFFLLHNIYNFQINDNAYLKDLYNYKNIYDSFILSRTLSILNSKFDKHFQSYFFIIDKLGIKTQFNNKLKLSFFKILKQKLVSNKIIGRIYYKIIILSFIKIEYYSRRLFLFLIYNDYRKYIFNRLLNSLKEHFK